MRSLRFPMGKPPPDVHAWWRVEIRSYSVVVDPEREEYGTTTHIEAHWFKVLRLTAKGAWLQTEPFSTVLQDNRWCARVARKRFACPTLPEAVESALARRARRLRILENTVWREKEIVDALTRIKDGTRDLL